MNYRHLCILYLCIFLQVLLTLIIQYAADSQHWYKSTDVILFTQHGAAENLAPDNFSSKFCIRMRLLCC